MREKKLTQSLDSRVSSLEQAQNRRNMEEIVNKITWEWEKTLGKKKRIQKGYFVYKTDTILLLFSCHKRCVLVQRV